MVSQHCHTIPKIYRVLTSIRRFIETFAKRNITLKKYLTNKRFRYIIYPPPHNIPIKTKGTLIAKKQALLTLFFLVIMLPGIAPANGSRVAPKAGRLKATILVFICLGNNNIVVLV